MYKDELWPEEEKAPSSRLAMPGFRACAKAATGAAGLCLTAYGLYTAAQENDFAGLVSGLTSAAEDLIPTEVMRYLGM